MNNLKYGLIDVGSNTIRTVIYEVEDKNFKQLINQKDFSGIISYVEDDKLSDAGTCKIVSVLNEMTSLCNLVGCQNILCFATASLRHIENTDAVIKKVLNETGIKIDIISGSKEAEYDYLGLKLSVSDSNGIGLDLGGGSCQIFSFRDHRPNFSASIKVGSLLIYNDFVKNIFPTKKETKNIKNYVKAELIDLPEIEKLGYETLYSMGGSARAAAKLHRAINNSNEPVSNYIITLEQMDYLIKIIDDMGISGIRLISQIIPERINTIIPGLIVLKTICRHSGAKQIQTIKNGVREGYLWKNIIDNPDYAVK